MIKFSWELVHGGCELIEKKSITLKKEEDINLIRALTNLPFESHMNEGFTVSDKMIDKIKKYEGIMETLPDDKTKKEWKEWLEADRIYNILVNLYTVINKNYKSSSYVNYFEQFDETFVNYDIYNFDEVYDYCIKELLMEINFIKNDITSSGFHFANVIDFKETTIENKTSKKEFEKIKKLFASLSEKEQKELLQELTESIKKEGD